MLPALDADAGVVDHDVLIGGDPLFQEAKPLLLRPAPSRLMNESGTGPFEVSTVSSLSRA